LQISRGDIFFADLSPVIGSEQGGVRPVLVVQNDVGNKFSPTVIVVAITSRISKAQLPIHVEVTREDHGLDRDSVILCEQIRTIDKERLRERVAHLAEETMAKVDDALMISLGLTDI